ncbi:GmrSD restriction endonuclease domain-containing protein [Actinokineospora enzanensis]|uniref:GmrSD restriction endonuclease domain-containing protein n=1 Tax=Actinokineospora enzanensis TaxID=155975 RepID=UPI00037F4F1F|nr:DUF262 domain-containing protein [Actinokineospora enzanensis]
MVVARETSLQELLEGSKQYRVPLYQRTYSWDRDQLVRLWEDVVHLAGDRLDQPDATHFIGSVVLAPSPANGPAGVSEYLVVDGQQRLTTLTLLLCAIRDHRARAEEPGHRDRINQQYLVNPWKKEPQRLKLVPTQADADAYLACVDGTPQAGGADPVGFAYRFFGAEVERLDESGVGVEQVEDAVISGLALVSVTTQHGDNAYRIFESLNNTGLRLTQADLLRNYLFMRLPTRGEEVYRSLWLPLQDRLSGKDLELLFWLDLVHRDPRVKQTDVYAGQQRRLERLRTEDEIVAEVERFNRLGTLLGLVLDPTGEENQTVRTRLSRLKDWGTTTVYPLLLHLLDRRSASTATSEEIATAMLHVESFFVRRLLIGRATANVNRVLLSTVTEMADDVPVDQAVHRYLSSGRKYYATDQEVRTAVHTVPFYLNGRPNQRALVLRWLEETYGSREPVDFTTLTIEHVLPQTSTDEWERAVGAELAEGETYEQVHQAVLHTIGNLTLTGYNARLGNKSFEDKRKHLADSGLAMNHEIARAATWGPGSIRARADRLATAVTKTWPGPTSVGKDAEPAWDLMNAVLAALPAGAWTTYGDLAAVIGSHPIAVGARLASEWAPNAHRVLQVGGTVSPNFAWVDPGRTDDPAGLLSAEGVVFDERGRAARDQRFTLDDLAELVGVDLEEHAEPDDDFDRLGGRFEEQLTASASDEVCAAVDEVVEGWIELGGWVELGTARTETSCFLFARGRDHENGNIWPVVLYPATGRVEIVFQHLRVRPPFTDPALREELRTRLNRMPGVSIPRAKTELRPSFALSVLADPLARREFRDTLRWFHEHATLGA